MTHDPTPTALGWNARDTPHIQWFGDDDGLISARTYSDGAGVMFQRTDRFGAALGADSPMLMSGDAGGFISTKAGVDRFAIRASLDNAVSLNGRLVTANPSGSLAANGWYQVGDSNLRAMAFPDDVSRILYSTASQVLQRANNNGPNSVPSSLSNATAVSLDMRPEIIEFDRAVRSSGDVAALIARKTGNACQSVLYSGGSWQTMMDLPLPEGNVVCIAMSPDQRLAAVSVVDGGVYTTRIFRRLGVYYTPKQDIANIGGHLVFSEDGMLLVDITVRKCFERLVDETFTEVLGALDSVPTDQRTAVFSKGTLEQTAISYLYDAGLPVVASGMYDQDGLMFTLLSDAATYDPAETDLGAILADEVLSGLWPAGGIPLTNVAAVSSGGQYYLSADPITRIIIGSTGLSARYGLIYDDTGDLPLVFIDFRGEVAVPVGRELVVTFPDGAIIRFEK